MKKLISLFAALTLTASAVPSVSAFADEETSAEAVDHISKTVTIGDVNNSGQIDIGDLVTASRFFLGEDIEDLSSMLLDVNLDGENDIFDLIGLRKLLLSPETSKVQEYIMDIVKSQVRLNSDNIKIENAEDAVKYFEEILSDSEEIKKFTELYDEEFFKENVLILRSMAQEKSDSLIFDFSDIDYNSITKCLDIDIENILDNLSAEVPWDTSDFECILTQISIPKEMSDMIEGVLLTSESTGYNFDDFNFIKLISPDGLHELLISGDSDDYTLFLNDDGDIQTRFIEEIDSNIFDLFEVGDWSVDESGNTVFTDTDGNKVSWGHGFADISYVGADGTKEQFEVGYPVCDDFDKLFNLDEILDGLNELLNF